MNSFTFLLFQNSRLEIRCLQKRLLTKMSKSISILIAIWSDRLRPSIKSLFHFLFKGLKKQQKTHAQIYFLTQFQLSINKVEATPETDIFHKMSCFG